MQRINEMMELYGQFIRIFNRRFDERLATSNVSASALHHKRAPSKENASEFVKKAFKEKCISLMNRKLEFDGKDDAVESKDRTLENSQKKDAKDCEILEKKGLEEIKKNITDLCESLNNNTNNNNLGNFDFVLGNAGADNSSSLMSLKNQKQKPESQGSNRSKFGGFTTNSEITNGSNQKKTILKKSSTMKLDSQEKKAEDEVILILRGQEGFLCLR
jgi:hypothetical protein